MNSVIQSVLDLPAMSQLNDLINNYKYSTGETESEKLADAGLKYGASQASSFILPNFVKGLASGTDDTVRDTSADTYWQQALNSVMSGVPGLRQNLPAAVDSFGNERKQASDPVMNFLNNNILPGSVTDYKQDPLSKEIAELSDTLGASLFPDRKAPNKIKADGETYALNTTEKQQYHLTYGNTFKEFAEKVMSSGAYAQMSDEDKSNVLTDVRDYANQVAKQEALANRGVEIELTGNAAKAAEAESQGITAGDWFTAKYEYDAINKEDLKAGEKATQFAAWLDGQSYSAKQKDYLREQMRYWSMVPAEAARYDGLTEAGIESKTALALTESMSTLTAPEGKSSVQKWQQYGAIAGTGGLSEAQKASAMAVYEGVSSGDKSKVQTAEHYGVAMNDFADFSKVLYDFKLTDSGSVTKDELTVLLNATSYDDRTKAILWAMNTTAKSGNPYGKIYNGTMEWKYAE